MSQGLHRINKPSFLFCCPVVNCCTLRHIALLMPAPCMLLVALAVYAVNFSPRFVQESWFLFIVVSLGDQLVGNVSLYLFLQYCLLIKEEYCSSKYLHLTPNLRISQPTTENPESEPSNWSTRCLLFRFAPLHHISNRTTVVVWLFRFASSSSLNFDQKLQHQLSNHNKIDCVF